MPALPRCPPADVGVDPAGVRSLLDAWAAHHLEIHAVMLLRHGRVFAEAAWQPYSLDDPVGLYSLSKTFTSAAVGLAVADGVLGYDDRLVDVFGSELAGVEVGPKAASIRIRDCLAMATGHTIDEAVPFAAGKLPGAGPWREYLAVEPAGTPGVTYCYHQWATYTLAECVRRTTGATVREVLRDRIFEPLGITDASWETDPHGRILGFTGLRLSPESIARFFQLLLDEGVSDGVRLLPMEWLGEYAQVHTATSINIDPDWRLGYGWQVWRSRVGFRGDGALGQFGLVWPEHDTVVVVTAGTDCSQAVLEDVWAHLLPAIDRVPADAGGVDGRVAGLRLDPVWGERGSLVHLSFENRHNRWRLTDDTAGWLLRWVDADGGDNTIAVGHHDWRFSVMTWRERAMRVAASGAWVGWGHFVVKVVSLSSPHWMLVHLRDDGSGWTEWNHEPLRATSFAGLAPERRSRG